MKKSRHFLIIFFVLITTATITNAQLKIGANPTSINNGQLVELATDGTRAGLKLAEVALTSTTDITTVNIPSSAVGTIVWNTGSGGVSTPGLYVWDGSSWNLLQTSTAVVGDIKTGIQTSDHNGWIKLDGRAISTLTATQQAAAASLGLSGSLPDASSAVLMQNGNTLGSVSGSNNRTIAQNQLPNVQLGGKIITTYNTSNDANSQGWPENGDNSIRTTDRRDYYTSRTDMILTNSINGGVTQQSLDITPKSLSVNTFIYLGN